MPQRTLPGADTAQRTLPPHAQNSFFLTSLSSCLFFYTAHVPHQFVSKLYFSILVFKFTAQCSSVFKTTQFQDYTRECLGSTRLIYHPAAGQRVDLKRCQKTYALYLKFSEVPESVRDHHKTMLTNTMNRETQKRFPWHWAPSACPRALLRC